MKAIRCLSLVAVAAMVAGTPGTAQEREAQAAVPAAPAKTASLLYKEEPRRLRMTVYYPDGWQESDRRPALVIFRCRIPEQREFFRQRGMVVIKPQVAAVNSGKLPGMTLEEIAQMPRPRDQFADAKSAIRYIRQNAARLGVDPARIVATGTSGGGDIALQAHLNRSFEDPNDDTAVSPSPDALVLYCPAFDGIDIWYVKSETLLARTRSEAPAFLPLLDHFVENMENGYSQPLDHRATLIEKAAQIGAQNSIAAAEIEAFQKVLELFNERDWQLLHPAADALKCSASRILTREPLPPTIILFGDRDHLFEHQVAFVEKAREMGQDFELKIYPGGGHSFMTQPAFQQTSTRDVERFLVEVGMLEAE